MRGIYIDSNGGNTSVSVFLTVTCILVKPNPVRHGDIVTFYGSGLIPGKTS